VRTIAYGDGVVGERNEASRAKLVKAESEPATWPSAMAESKCISPTYNDAPLFIEVLNTIVLEADRPMTAQGTAC
jgi:hypothetical protein